MFQDLLNQMTREDFLARDNRKQELFNPTKEEIQEQEAQRISKKESIVLPILSDLEIERSDDLESMFYNLLNSKREKYKKLLGSDDVFADLSFEAKERAKSGYESFLDFVIKYEADILSIIQ